MTGKLWSVSQATLAGASWPLRGVYCFICIYLDTRSYRRLSQKVESGSAYLTRRFVLLVPLIACKMVVAIAVWCVSTGCT